LSRARLGLNPTVNAIATITVAVVAVGVLATSMWLSRQERMRAAEQSAAYREGMQVVEA
jgi:putrescine transport system permease protein